jgi:hypothetical protein
MGAARLAAKNLPKELDQRQFLGIPGYVIHSSPQDSPELIPVFSEISAPQISFGHLHAAAATSPRHSLPLPFPTAMSIGSLLCNQTFPFIRVQVRAAYPMSSPPNTF